MTTLTEQLFRGTWRSYKTFYRSGNVKNHSSTNFEEFDFSDNKVLTITLHKDGKSSRIERTDKWSIELNNKRHYLKFENSPLCFEVITINHTTLVLMDMNTNEKSFFAPYAMWEQYMKTQTTHVL